MSTIDIRIYLQQAVTYLILTSNVNCCNKVYSMLLLDNDDVGLLYTHTIR